MNSDIDKNEIEVISKTEFWSKAKAEALFNPTEYLEVG